MTMYRKQPALHFVAYLDSLFAFNKGYVIFKIVKVISEVLRALMISLNNTNLEMKKKSSDWKLLMVILSQEYTMRRKKF